jgi:hypothetical protein
MSVPPSGRRIDLWGMSLYRIKDGMATEIWESFERMEFLGKLDVMSSSTEQSEEASPT